MHGKRQFPRPDTFPGVASLGDLQLSNRVRRILAANGVDDLDDLTALNERQLLGLPRFGYGCLEEVAEKLAGAGLGLEDDPYAPYVCARHGERANDTNLADLFLCDECADTWQKEAFDDTPAEFEGEAVDGYCLNCNVYKDDVRLRQWFLCGT